MSNDLLSFEFDRREEGKVLSWELLDETGDWYAIGAGGSAGLEVIGLDASPLSLSIAEDIGNGGAKTVVEYAIATADWPTGGGVFQARVYAVPAGGSDPRYMEEESRLVVRDSGD